MSKGLTSKEPIPLKRGEYLDCPNVCDARSAKWRNGDAICPECGEAAVVYDRTTYFRTNKSKGKS